MSTSEATLPNKVTPDQIAPLWNQVLVRKVTEKDRMYGSIYIPDSSSTKNMTATVLSIGPDVNKDFLGPGDVVLLDFYGGFDFGQKEGLEDVLLVEEHAIKCKIEDFVVEEAE